MRIGTAVLSLIASLAIVSCKKKELESDPPRCSAEKKEAVACREQMVVAEDSLDVCKEATGWPHVGRHADVAPSDPAPATVERAEDDVLEEFEPKIGETYVLGQGNQTVVMNPKPVQDGLRRFAKGSVCRFDPMGKVKIVGKRVYKMDGDGEEETEYLVRYAREPAPEALHPGVLEYPDADPYECPDGTVFYLDDVSILEPVEPDAAFEAAKKLLNSEKP